MFRRLFWLAMGAGFGFGMSFWLMRTLRGTVDRYRPERLGADLGGTLKALGADLRTAASEGRIAMHDREVELRAGPPSADGADV